MKALKTALCNPVGICATATLLAACGGGSGATTPAAG